MHFLLLHFRGLALRHYQLVVNAFVLHKLGVRAALCQMPFVENYQPVRGAQGREPVGYRNGSPARRKLAERFLYLLFGLGVERGCRFVEDYYLRVVQDRTRDGYSLALAAR